MRWSRYKVDKYGIVSNKDLTKNILVGNIFRINIHGHTNINTKMIFAMSNNIVVVKYRFTLKIFKY